MVWPRGGGVPFFFFFYFSRRTYQSVDIGISIGRVYTTHTYRSFIYLYICDPSLGGHENCDEMEATCVCVYWSMYVTPFETMLIYTLNRARQRRRQPARA